MMNYMGSYIAGVKKFFSEIIVYNDADKRVIFNGSIIILVISAIACALAGIYSLTVFPIIILAYFSLKNYKFLVYLFISLSPIVTTISPSLINIFYYGFIAVILFFWLARKLFSSSMTFEYSRELLIFSLLVVLFSVVSVLPGGVNLKEFLAVIRYIIFFSFVLILYDMLETYDIPKIFIAMTIPLLVAAYFLFSVYAQSLNPLAMLELIRLKVTGFLPSANLLGLLLMSVLPFWISVTLWWDKPKIRIFAGILTSIFTLAMLLSNSRASIFGFAVAVLMFSIWTKKFKYYIAIILVAVLVFAFVPQLNSMVKIAYRMDRGTSSRVDIWKNTITMIYENLPFGVGMGNYGTAYDKYFESGWERRFFERMPHAHNFLLSKLAELGIFGLFVAFGVYYIPIRTIIRSMKISKNRKDVIISRCFTAIFVSFFAHSIFEGGGMLQEGRVQPDMLFWVLLVLALKHKLYLERQGDDNLLSTKA